jgi:hypothetical protein
MSQKEQMADYQSVGQKLGLPTRGTGAELIRPTAEDEQILTKAWEQVAEHKPRREAVKAA